MSGLRAIIYTDGGADSPRGAGGSGVYGYTYSEEASVPNDDNYHPTTAGYFSVVNKPSSAKWVQPIEYFEGMVSYPMQVTNNVAELGAAILAFQTIQEKGWTNVLIRPDSQYVRQNYIENLDRWKQGGWITISGGQVANQNQWESLAQFKAEFSASGTKVDWLWVKGHSEDPGNQRADSLATQAKEFARLAKACRVMRFTDAEPVVRGDKVKIPPANKLLSMVRWYFINDAPETVVDKKGFYVYYGGSHGKDDELFAKPMADSTYAVCFLKEPDPVLESIREKQYKLNPDGYSEMVIGHLDNILNSRTYGSIFTNGTRWVDPCPGTNDLMYGEDQLITRELTKPRLALNAIDTLMEAETLLRNFLDGESKNVTTTELTAGLYDIEEKKNKIVYKLKKSIDTATKTFPVSIDYSTKKGETKTLKTRIVLGQDCPRRNSLSHLASRSPKVTLLSWSRDAGSIFFATVVEAEGEASIWMGHPANYRVIPKE